MTKTLRLPKKQSLLLLAIFAVHGIFVQTIRYVNASLTTGSNNGTTWANAYKDLQPALAAAQSGDQIWVAKGTYYPTTSTTDRTASFVMKNNVGIYGGFAGAETSLSQRDWKNNVTTLSGDIDHATNPLVVTGSGSTLSITGNLSNSYHVIYNYSNSLDNTAILDGFAISGGCYPTGNSYPNYYGAGMNNYLSSPSIANCNFFGNNASSGGGMNNEYAYPIITNCNFLKNNAEDGGGGMINEGSGSSNPSLFPNISNCIFLGNRAVNKGGGMFNTSSSLKLYNVVFSGNNVIRRGGGMYNEGSVSMNILNVVFSGNSAGDGGGGMSNYGGLYTSPINIINCLFFGNTATYGAGILNFASYQSLQNNIIWGNSDGVYEVSTTSTITYSNIQGGYTGTGNINQDPLFVNAANPAGVDGVFGTADDGLALQTASPCINTGNNAAIPTGATTDITGLPRIAGSTVDMGAYESQTAVLPLQLLSFVGSRQISNNVLYWKTTNEIGTKTFEVESSANGNNFSPIGNLLAIGGGNYLFTDINPMSNPTYYRLKMMDADNRFTYSGIIRINGATTNNISVYPNPVAKITTLDIGDNVSLIGTQVQLTDSNGRLIKTIMIKHNQEQLDMTPLPYGIYILKFKDSNVIKLMKQ